MGRKAKPPAQPSGDAQKIVLPVEHGATPPPGRPPSLPVEHGTPPAKRAPLPRETSPTPAKRKPRPAAPKPVRKGRGQPSTLPGSAAEQASYLRRVMVKGDDRQLRRAIARLFRSGPARTAKVLKTLLPPPDRRLLVRVVYQVAESRSRALKVYDHLRAREARHCGLAVLFATAEAAPGNLYALFDRLRQKHLDMDADLLVSASAWLPGRNTPAHMPEEVAKVLRYTSRSAEAEAQLRLTVDRTTQPAAGAAVPHAASPPAGSVAEDGRTGWWTAFLRFLAALFRRRG